MATNMIFKYSTSGVNAPKVRTLSSSKDSGQPVFDPNDARPAVTLTASGDLTKTVTENLPYGWGSVTGVAVGGASLIGKETTLAYDGTWEFSDVVTSGTSATTTAVAQGTTVYLNTTAAHLTLASGEGTLYGYVDYPIDYEKAAGVLPVRIGNDG